MRAFETAWESCKILFLKKNLLTQFLFCRIPLNPSAPEFWRAWAPIVTNRYPFFYQSFTVLDRPDLSWSFLERWGAIMNDEVTVDHKCQNSKRWVTGQFFSNLWVVECIPSWMSNMADSNFLLFLLYPGKLLRLSLTRNCA